MTTISERDRAVFWHPCSQMTDYETFAPKEVIGAQGVYLELANGQQVIDAVSSWWCKALGHGHPHLVEALTTQAQRFDQIIAANTVNADLVRLCERLLSLANGDTSEHWGPRAPAGKRSGHFDKVFLTDNGSTGMEIAMKMAIHAKLNAGKQQRTHFAALQNGYHGETIATLAVGDCGLYGKPYESLMFPVTMIESIPYRSGPTDPHWNDASSEWERIEQQLAPLADSLAGIVYEPILQGAGGMLVYSPDLLRRLRAWADAHNVYLIADEIAAGMGRTGKMLAGHHAQTETGTIIQPDFAVISKGLTGGMISLCAVVTTQAVYQHFLADYFDMKAFMHSNTWTGNGLAVAVANAALDVFAEEQICERVQTVEPQLRNGLSALATTRPYLGPVRNCGMMAAIDILGMDPKKRIGWKVFQEAITRGAWLRNLGDTLYLFPPLTISDNEIQALLSILADSLDSIIPSNN